MILREDYLNKLIRLKDKHIIKIITGIRRCGKSTLLNQFKDYLLDNNINEKNIISINFEDLQYEELTNYKKLYIYLKDKIARSEKYYIILDEIQRVQDFQKVVDSFFLNENLDIYITGSNSYMLSSEISTLLSGRYVLIEMLPLSFKEFISNEKDISNLESLYTKYIFNGSFPYVKNLSDDRESVIEYLEGIYNTIVINDIINRKKITDPQMLKSILAFIFSNIGSQLSPKKIADTMTSYGRKIDSRTIENYISALLESYIIYCAKRYDIKGKEYLKTLNKYYIVDPGLRYILLGNRNIDQGHILENVIYLELLRRGYKVFVGKQEREEVDFVCQKDDKEIYIQVALTTRTEETLNRELKPLRSIKNSYPKYILTLDEEPDVSYDGIIKTNALKWLIK